VVVLLACASPAGVLQQHHWSNLLGKKKWSKQKKWSKKQKVGPCRAAEPKGVVANKAEKKAAAKKRANAHCDALEGSGAFCVHSAVSAGDAELSCNVVP
jgi:hypothetical protein